MSSKNALVLLFSPREKKRTILAAGLIHAGYRVVEAGTAYVAGVKANQYLPDVVIADIAQDNIRDFLFLNRLETSERTRKISVLLSVTAEVRQALNAIREEVGGASDPDRTVSIIEYPYKFNRLTERIEELRAHRQQQDAPPETMPGRSRQILNEQLLSMELSVEKKLQFIGSQVDKQWAFPFTVMRSLEIMGTDNSSCRELAKCIETDLAATAALISMANRITYASRFRKIETVLDAVVRIGFQETRNVLALLTLIDVSAKANIRYGFTRNEFWMHSLAVAVFTEKLCTHMQYDRPEVGFIAGLVHDIGKIPLDHQFANIFRSLLEETTNRIASFASVEEAMMGLTHADIGHYFTTTWEFPSAIRSAVLNHHDTERILSTKSHADRQLQAAVFAANIFAKAMCFGHSCDEVLCDIPKEILAILKLPDGPPFNFVDKVFVTLRQYSEYLRLAAGEVTLREPERNTRDSEVLFVLGEETVFHPLIMALQFSGCKVSVTKAEPSDCDVPGRTIIFIPDRDHPLDIVLDEEETSSEDLGALRIFLLEGREGESQHKEFVKGNVILMDRGTVDLRFLLHIMEDYRFGNSMRAAGL